MAAEPGSTAAVDETTAVVDLGLRACDAYGRSDLTGRLEAAKRKLADPAVHVVVVGEFKQGKSTLINALVGARVCPVDDDVATALPTFVRFGSEPGADLRFDEDPPRWEPIGLDEVGDAVLERNRPAAPSGVTGASTAAEPRPAAVEVRVPADLVADGLVLVDTPGVGGLASGHAAASLAAASMADALIFVTDASQELTSSEIGFLRQARAMCERIVCVLTKIDFYPAWRTIRDLDAGHLHGELDVPIVPVSSMLRSRALETGDDALGEESGFAELIRFLSEEVGLVATERLTADAAAEVVTVCSHLESQFEGERAALTDPARAEEVVTELSSVRDRVETLRSAAARWSQTLADGITDLGADVDHDLRRRMRTVVQEADAAIERSDPDDTWPEMASWLEARVAHELLANYALLRDRATALSEEVGHHFAEAFGDVLERVAVRNPVELLEGARVDDPVEPDRMKVGMQAMVALRSAYGGAVMFVMLGSMVGITLAPLAAGIGLVMGRRGLRDEKKRQRTARQQQARNGVRRYCDEATFVAGKDSRDTLRRIQRQLRDHYAALAEELERSNAEALQRASEAVTRSKAEREKRLRDVEAELERVRQLRRRALEAGPAGALAGGTGWPP